MYDFKYIDILGTGGLYKISLILVTWRNSNLSKIAEVFLN